MTKANIKRNGLLLYKTNWGDNIVFNLFGGLANANLLEFI